MFGAGDAKFAATIKMKSQEEGAMVKQTYFTKLPKIKRLLDRLEEDFKMYKKALEEEFGKSHPISKVDSFMWLVLMYGLNHHTNC